jgi:copper transport protein
VVLGAAALIVGSLGRIFLQAGYIDAPISRILRTDVGRAWATTAVLALPIGLLATGLARLLDRRVHAIALVVLGVLAGRSIASGGHGASGRAPLLGNALTVVHVAAASLWIGGLVGVILCVRRREDAAAERAVRRFSTVALCTVALLAITGTLQGIRQLDTFDALTGSPYGKLLIIKVAVIGVLLAVAALSRFALRAGEIVLQAEGDDARRWPWQQVLGRTVAVELLVAAIVIGITGTLAGASPLVSASTGPVNLALLQGDRTAYISVFPAKAGDNAIHITIDEPSITGPDEVTVELTPSDGRTGAIAVPVVNAGPGHVIADNAVIPFPGQWTIKVDARYGEFELVTFTGDFKVG